MNQEIEKKIIICLFLEYPVIYTRSPDTTCVLNIVVNPSFYGGSLWKGFTLVESLPTTSIESPIPVTVTLYLYKRKYILRNLILSQIILEAP